MVSLLSSGCTTAESGQGLDKLDAAVGLTHHMSKANKQKALNIVIPKALAFVP